jgi:hypothetical protein
MLAKRGEAPRMNQNTLLFLAPDLQALVRLKDQVRTVLAWESIVKDVKAKRLKLGADQVYVDQHLLLVKPEAARRQIEAEMAAIEAVTPVVAPSSVPQAGAAQMPIGLASPASSGTPHDAGSVAVKTAPKTVRYIGTKVFFGAVAASQIRPLLEEIHSLLLQSSKGEVKLRIEIEGENPDGFSEQMLRALRENSTSLGVDGEFD